MPSPLLPEPRLITATPDSAAWEADEEVRPQLSAIRVALAILLAAGAVFGIYSWLNSRVVARTESRATTWFAPYVDVTLSPTYSFQNPGSDPARQVVLGFVVSDPSSSCEPSWGADYTLAQADQILSLSSRVAELKQEGAQSIVSFGGQANTDLAVGCHNVSALESAYQSVVSDYHLQTIDLDVEGPALDNFTANQRRAEAIKSLETTYQKLHQSLGVWLTLPVEPSGLQDNATSLISTMLRQGVNLAGINILAMDMSPPATGATMLAEVERSANSAERQVVKLYRRFGVNFDQAQAWRRIGVTVMIGQNDLTGEQFTVNDARGLATFAGQVGMGRLSMWSLNRDSQCGTNFAEIGVESTTCSGTTQDDLAFSKLFSQLDGTSSALPSNAVPPTPDTDPSNAPYPMWSPTVSYQTGYLVVREGYIYEAKWYNAGEDPAAQIQYDWQTPWELLGPVLSTDHAPTVNTLPAGAYPAWSASIMYVAGNKVLYDGLAYLAKWTNQGASPAGEASDPSSSPWEALYTIPGEPPASG